MGKKIDNLLKDNEEFRKDNEILKSDNEDLRRRDDIISNLIYDFSYV